MRLFIQLANGVPTAWPLIGDNVRYLAPPNVSFPASADAYETVDLTEFGFETFIEAAQPAFDPLTQKVLDTTPVKVLGQWTRQWSVVALTAAEASAAQAKAAEAQRLSAIDANIAGDTTIASLKAMSSADFDSWWTANVTTLAQANNVLKRIARVVLRRVL